MDGKIVTLAILGGRYVENFDTALLLGKRASIIGSTLRNRDDTYKSKLVESFNKHCLMLFEKQALRPFVDTHFGADEVELAHQRMMRNDSKGKFVVTWQSL